MWLLQKWCFLLLIGFMPLGSFGQAPGLINYQAVARDAASGAEIANETIFFQAIIRAGGPSGEIIFQESHPNVSTNDFGLFSLQIGAGEAVTGSLTAIDWNEDNLWLEVELDAGEGLQNMGSMQLVSVPFALHANTANASDTALYALSVENTNDADADPTNELINSVVFDSTSNALTLQDAGGSYSINLSSLVEDADADPNNERIDGIFYSLASNTITISEGGQNYSAGLGPVNLDIDPTNELIDANSLSLDNQGILQLSEGGIVHQVDLSPLIIDPLWQLNESQATIHTLSNRVAIGVSSAAAQLQIRSEAIAQAPLLRLENQESTALLEVDTAALRISSEVSTSIGGAVSYGVRVIEKDFAGTITYPLANEDSHIVVRVFDNVTGLVRVLMPAASDHPGRKVVIRHTGELGAFSILQVEFEEGDFADGGNEYTAPAAQRITKTFLSLGNAGWTELF